MRIRDCTVVLPLEKITRYLTARYFTTSQKKKSNEKGFF